MSTRRAAAEPLDLAVARECPTAPGEIITALEYGLFKAMRRRASGIWHLRTCLGSQVTAIPVECSRDCQRTQIALAWAQLWLSRNVVPKPSQPGLWADEAPGPARGMGRAAG